jgi:ParB-like chromosome segregation protein Spo0J
VSTKGKKPLDTFEYKLPIELIDCSDDFPRRQDLGDIGKLSRSLSKDGLIEPIVVRRKECMHNWLYVVCCG